MNDLIYDYQRKVWTKVNPAKDRQIDLHTFLTADGTAYHISPQGRIRWQWRHREQQPQGILEESTCPRTC